jgi:hypothetical protein
MEVEALSQACEMVSHPDTAYINSQLEVVIEGQTLRASLAKLEGFAPDAKTRVEKDVKQVQLDKCIKAMAKLAAAIAKSSKLTATIDVNAAGPHLAAPAGSDSDMGGALGLQGTPTPALFMDFCAIYADVVCGVPAREYLDVLCQKLTAKLTDDDEAMQELTMGFETEENSWKRGIDPMSSLAAVQTHAATTIKPLKGKELLALVQRTSQERGMMIVDISYQPICNFHCLTRVSNNCYLFLGGYVCYFLYRPF